MVIGIVKTAMAGDRHTLLLWHLGTTLTPERQGSTGTTLTPKIKRKTAHIVKWIMHWILRLPVRVQTPVENFFCNLTKKFVLLRIFARGIRILYYFLGKKYGNFFALKNKIFMGKNFFQICFQNIISNLGSSCKNTQE
jgi:hypothetical protein